MGLLIVLTVLVVALLAYANGSNDVSKGVATLAGGHVTTYRQALLWGTVWTILGGLAAWVFTQGMVKTFTTGILPQGAPLPPAFPLAIALASLFWVGFSSLYGLPVSTTHAIVGSILGLGLFLFGSEQIRWSSLLNKIILPLLVSPVLSLLLSRSLFPLLRFARKDNSELCLCIGVREPGLGLVEERGEVVISYSNPPERPITVVASQEECIRYYPTALRLSLNTLHYLSSGLVNFSRGMNDAPKIAAIGILSLLTVQTPAFVPLTFFLVAIGMGLGSWIAGEKVTRVMGERVTEMDHFDGCVANLATSLLVITTAMMGLPVSTTHCSNGAIIGVGLKKGVRTVKWDTVRHMLLAWCVTAPLSGICAVIFYLTIGVIVW